MADRLPNPPSEWLRVKWVSGVFAGAILLMHLDDVFRSSRPSPNFILLTALCGVALMVAAFIVRDIWSMHVRRAPVWMKVLLVIVVVSCCAATIFVLRTRSMVWNSVYVHAPLILLLASLAIAAAVTEAKKNVRVYFGGRSHVYVHENTER